MNKQPSCQNCHSPRRAVKERGLCSVCIKWQRRIDNYSAKLERVRSDPGKYYVKCDARALFGRISVAKRVLDELRWREEGLLASTTDSWDVETLICMLASVCRSELAFNTHSLIEQMSPKSRRKIYEALLTIVENIPSDLPKLHFMQYLKKGAYGNGNEGWYEWIRESKFSREHLEEVKARSALEKAYVDSLKQKTSNI